MLFLTELLLQMQIISSTLTLLCCVPPLCFLLFFPSPPFLLMEFLFPPPPQQELAGSPCSGRQEIWIKSLAEAGCIIRLPQTGQSFSHELLCSLSCSLSPAAA